MWRRFQEPDRPVILLLGGAAGAGKTSLALEVGHRLGIHRVLSTDAIRQIMRLMLAPELVPAIHASSYDAYQAIGRGEDGVIDGFLAQASIVSVGVRAMLDRAVAENSSQILDGVSIVPGIVDLAAYAESAHVIFLVVATLDERAFRDRFESRARTSNRPQHRYLEHFDAILKIQDHFLELADRHDIPIVDNESIDVSVLSIIKHVTETLRKVGPLRRPGAAGVAASSRAESPEGERMASSPPAPRTLGALRKAGVQTRPLREELRANLLARIRAGDAALRRHPRLRRHAWCPPSRTRCSAATT